MGKIPYLGAGSSNSMRFPNHPGAGSFPQPFPVFPRAGSPPIQVFHGKTQALVTSSRNSMRFPNDSREFPSAIPGFPPCPSARIPNSRWNSRWNCCSGEGRREGFSQSLFPPQTAPSSPRAAAGGGTSGKSGIVAQKTGMGLGIGS